MLTQLEEKRQQLEKARAEADRLWRQREEDARKARNSGSRWSGPRKTPRSRGEGRGQAPSGRGPAAADQIVPRAGPAAEAAEKDRTQEMNDPAAAVRTTSTRREDRCAVRDESGGACPSPPRPSRSEIWWRSPV